jgi:hypothetical protein
MTCRVDRQGQSNVLRRELPGVLPAVAVLLGLVLYQIVLNPTWVGDADDGAYFLMSRNVWHYGVPLLNQNGSAHWSSSWSPALSFLLAPLGALPMAASVVAERVAVLVAGVAFLLLGYCWMRRDLGLSRLYAGIATTCVAASFTLVRVSSLVLSDAPAAVAVMAGIVLFRRDRWRTGLACFAVGALIRPINAAVFVAAVVWLSLTHPVGRKLLVPAAIAVAGALALFAIALALGGFRGYLSQIANPGQGGVTQTLVDQVKELTWYPLGWFSPVSEGSFRIVLKLVSAGLFVLAAVVAVRRRLVLESMVVAATVVVLLVYRTTGTGDARYLIPLSPLFVGAIVAGFQLRPREWILPVVAGAAAAVVAADLYFFVNHTPYALDRNVGAKMSAYLWVKAHVPPTSGVVALNDLQSFLYSGHTTFTALRDVAPGQVFVIRMPVSQTDSWAEAHILAGHRGREVYRRGTVSVVEVDTRRSAARAALGER